MKKGTVCALFRCAAALVALLMLLTGCNVPLMGSLPASPTPAPTPASSSAIAESEQETPLPPQYFTKNGWLLLDLELDERDNREKEEVTIQLLSFVEPPEPFDGITPEELKEKLLNVRFTDEELEIFSQSEHKNGCVQMIDPRLLAPFSIPSGLILKETTYESYWSTGVWFDFYYEADDHYEACSALRASISFENGIGGAGQKVLDGFMNKNGEKITLEDGTVAICTEEVRGSFKGQTLRYVSEHKGRTYYVDRTLYFDLETGAFASAEALAQEHCKNYVTVTTVHKGHQFSYAVTNPVEGLAERILEMDPFTYL